MAKTTKKAEAAGGKREAATTAPKFAYSTAPNSLRKVLKLIPQKPRPPKVDSQQLKSWDLAHNNDTSVLRVLKAVGLIGADGAPTELYARYMDMHAGARALGPAIKQMYAPLFMASHAPYTEPSATLTNLFNIHSGGGTRTIEYQIQTFKALCESAVFDKDDPALGAVGVPAPGATITNSTGAAASGAGTPVVNINLHIHLPENKSRRDYEDMIEDIGRYIFGRTSDRNRE
jgi:hypothetical protein